jgi:fermentation-respiration switch protein FrsA (DUF1100 family)
VALHLASRNPLDGVIIENPFSSIKDMVRAIYPKWSIEHYLTRFLWNHWPSIDTIRHVKCPILLIHGEADVNYLRIAVHHVIRLLCRKLFHAIKKRL